MSRVSSLYRLQSIDHELDRSHTRLRETETSLKDADAVVGCRRTLAEAEARLQAARAAAKTAEYNAAAHQAKLEEAQKGLYDGSVRNPKELQDLQTEVESLDRYRPILEDRLLDAMVEVEQAELGREAANQELARIEALEASKNADLLEEQKQLLGMIERLEAEREAAVGDVPKEDLDLYAHLRDSRGGVAVALLQEDSCGACGLIQANSTRQTIRMGAELTRCRQCGRILYAG
jgi:predicted  nucleic acid-binding Zn-ribbon protein